MGETGSFHHGSHGVLWVQFSGDTELAAVGQPRERAGQDNDTASRQDTGTEVGTMTRARAKMAAGTWRQAGPRTGTVQAEQGLRAR